MNINIDNGVNFCEHCDNPKVFGIIVHKKDCLYTNKSLTLYDNLLYDVLIEMLPFDVEEDIPPNVNKIIMKIIRHFHLN